NWDMTPITQNVVSTTINVVAGTTYTLTFPLATGWGNNTSQAEPGAQYIDVTINGVNVFKGTSRAGRPNATYLFLNTQNSGLNTAIVPTTYTTTPWTATVTGPVTLT